MAQAKSKTKEVEVAKTDVQIRVDGFQKDLQEIVKKWQIGLQPTMRPELAPVDLKQEEEVHALSQSPVEETEVEVPEVVRESTDEVIQKAVEKFDYNDDK